VTSPRSNSVIKNKISRKIYQALPHGEKVIREEEQNGINQEEEIAL